MSSRIVGFTGSRTGITPKQEEALRQLLKWINPVEVHHGECVGADARFHSIVREVLPECKIVGHPPISDTFQADVACDEEWERKGYLNRDRDVVECSSIIIGMPKFFKVHDPIEREGAKHATSFRGGTWYTIQYGKKLGKEVVIVFPDGSVDRTEAKK